MTATTAEKKPLTKSQQRSERLIKWLLSMTRPSIEPDEKRERKVLSSSKDIRKHPVLVFCQETLKHLQERPFKMRSGSGVYRVHSDGSIRLVTKDTRSVKQRKRERREAREKLKESSSER